MSTGASYYLEKVQLAGDQLANTLEEPCSCHVMEHLQMVSLPYKGQRATETAKDDLRALKSALENDIDRVGEFLKRRRQELKKKEQETRLVLNANKNNRNQTATPPSSQPSPTITPAVKNSPAAAARPSQAANYPPGLGSRIRLRSPPKSPANSVDNSPNIPTWGQLEAAKYPNILTRICLKLKESERKLNPVWLQVTVEQHNQRKRKNDGLFDLESAAKRAHSGLCAPIEHHPVRKDMFIADKFDVERILKEIRKPRAAGIDPGLRPGDFECDEYPYAPKKPSKKASTQTRRTEAPVVDRAITRRLARTGVKLVQPEMDTGNFSRDGGLARDPNQPPKPPQNRIKQLPPVPNNKGTKDLISDTQEAADLAKIADRKAQKATGIFKQYREELEAFSRRHESLAYPSSEVNDKIAAKQVKRQLRKEKFDELGSLVAETNRARADCKIMKAVVLQEFLTHGLISPVFPHLLEALRNANRISRRLRRSWARRFRHQNNYLYNLQQRSAELDHNAFGNLNRELKVQDQLVKQLEKEFKKKTAAVGCAQAEAAPKDKVEAVNRAIVRKEESKAILLEAQQEYREINADIKLLTPSSITQPVSVRSSPESLYNNGGKCAKLAKDVLEAREKLCTMAREIGTINTKIGSSPNEPVLSAVPARRRDFRIKTNAPWQGIPSGHSKLRKPSYLRYELGACLQEKAAAEATQEQEEMDEQQRIQEAAEALK